MSRFLYRAKRYTKVTKIDDVDAEKKHLCLLTAQRLCENHTASYKEKNGTSIKAAVGVRPCRILAPVKYNEDMDAVLASVGIMD